MTMAIFGCGLPLTEAEFLALEPTNERVELFDGSLYVTPAPTPRHQLISRRLANILDIRPELTVLEGVNVRLHEGRIPIPDVVVTADIDINKLVIDASAVRLVCEIVSPSNAAADRVLKMHYYAAAGIPWHLLVDQETVALQLFKLTGDRYHELARALPGEVLRLSEPVEVMISPEDLLPPR